MHDNHVTCDGTRIRQGLVVAYPNLSSFRQVLSTEPDAQGRWEVGNLAGTPLGRLGGCDMLATITTAAPYPISAAQAAADVRGDGWDVDNDPTLDYAGPEA